MREFNISQIGQQDLREDRSVGASSTGRTSDLIPVKRIYGPSAAGRVLRLDT